MSGPKDEGPRVQGSGVGEGCFFSFISPPSSPRGWETPAELLLKIPAQGQPGASQGCQLRASLNL